MKLGALRHAIIKTNTNTQYYNTLEYDYKLKLNEYKNDIYYFVNRGNNKIFLRLSIFNNSIIINLYFW